MASQLQGALRRSHQRHLASIARHNLATTPTFPPAPPPPLALASAALQPPPPLLMNATSAAGDGLSSPWNFTGSVLEPLQEMLVTMHDASGLPWWATLCLSAVGVRVALLPVVLYQAHAAARLAVAMPGVGYLHQLLAASIRQLPVGDVRGRVAKVRAFLAGSRAAMRLQGASPLSAVAGPLLVQLPAFATMVMATRGLVAAGGHGLDAGGVLWAVDLTARDPTFLLPCLTVAATYGNLELSLGQRSATARQHEEAGGPGGARGSGSAGGAGVGRQGGAGPNTLHPDAAALAATDAAAAAPLGPDAGARGSLVPPPSPSPGPPAPAGIMGYFKDGVQTVVICGLPLIATLPAGAFCFWLTSSALTAGQIVAMRSLAVRKTLGLPPLSEPRR